MDLEIYNKTCILNILSKIPIKLDENQIGFILFTMLEINSVSEETYNHLIQTYNLACEFAKGFHLSEEDSGVLELSALVHDFGKLKIDKNILHSTKPLSPQEYEIIKTHSKHTYDMIKDVLPEKVALIAYHHHEKLNGSGYPQHLQEEQLTELDKMLTVCDITSALLQKRSYKEVFDKGEISSILNKLSTNGEINKTYCDFAISNCVGHSQPTTSEDELQLE